MKLTGRPGGNPDFGTLHKFPRKESEPLTRRLNLRLQASISDRLQEVASHKGIGATDLVRKIIKDYLEDQDKITA